jgi:hypothetical protein
MQLRVIAVLGIATIAYFGGGTYLYHDQEHMFNRDSQINSTNYIDVIDELKGDHIKPEGTVRAIFPVYVHIEGDARDKTILA